MSSSVAKRAHLPHYSEAPISKRNFILNGNREQTLPKIKTSTKCLVQIVHAHQQALKTKLIRRCRDILNVTRYTSAMLSLRKNKSDSHARISDPKEASNLTWRCVTCLVTMSMYNGSCVLGPECALAKIRKWRFYHLCQCCERNLIQYDRCACTAQPQALAGAVHACTAQHDLELLLMKTRLLIGW